MAFLTTFLYSQLLVTPQLPSHDFSKQTIIVTGSNTGLGFEAAKHFLHLHCAKLIIAVRTTSKGEDAKQALLSTLSDDGLQISPSQIQVWALDLSSSKSVRAFADRASTELERVDVLVENAGIDVQKFALSEDGWETTLQTNVISTCLLALLMLPKMRETAERFDTRSHLVVVTSDMHYMATFSERNAPEGILKALNEEKTFNASDRYATTKAIQILFIRELAHRLKSSSSSPYQPILTLVTPGLCVTHFFRDLILPESPLLHPLSSLAYIGVNSMLAVVGRTAEVGARTLVKGACAGEKANGQFMMDGEVRAVVTWMETEEGKVVQERIWREVCEAIGVNGEDFGKSMTDGE